MSENYSRYEQIALTFYHEGKYSASIHYFLICIQDEPKHSMAWYGLGDAVCAYGNQRNSEHIYALGVSLIKRSLSIDPNNQYAKPMLERMLSSSPLGPENISSIPIFEDSKLEEIKQIFQLEQDKLIVFFKECSNDNRIRIVIGLSEIGNFLDFDFLNDALLNDKEHHVKLAILKRIAIYSANPKLYDTFSTLSKLGNRENLEPYFTFALARIKQILVEIKENDWTAQIKKVSDDTSIINKENQHLNSNIQIGKTKSWWEFWK